MFVWLLVCLYDENKHDVGWCLKVLFKSGIDWLNWKWNDCLLTPTPSSKRHKKNVFRPPLKLVLAKWCCYTRCYYCCNSMFLLCFNSVVSNHCICTLFSLFFCSYCIDHVNFLVLFDVLWLFFFIPFCCCVLFDCLVVMLFVVRFALNWAPAADSMTKNNKNIIRTIT